MLDGPLVEEDSDDRTALLYPLTEAFSDYSSKFASDPAADRPRVEQAQELLLRGTDRFWFALCCLAGYPSLLRMHKDPAREAWFARGVLRAVVARWPELVALDAKYQGPYWGALPWPGWGRSVFCRCTDAGIPPEAIDAVIAADAAEAGRRLAALLAPDDAKGGRPAAG